MTYDVADVHDVKQWLETPKKRYTLTVENDETGENLLTISAPSEEMMLERLGAYERYIERASKELTLNQT